MIFRGTGIIIPLSSYWIFSLLCKFPHKISQTRPPVKPVDAAVDKARQPCAHYTARVVTRFDDRHAKSSDIWQILTYILATFVCRDNALLERTWLRRCSTIARDVYWRVEPLQLRLEGQPGSFLQLHYTRRFVDQVTSQLGQWLVGVRKHPHAQSTLPRSSRLTLISYSSNDLLWTKLA